MRRLGRSYSLRRVDSILRAMAQAPAAAPEKDLTRTYALVVIVEIITLAALFLLGKYFG